MGTTRTRLEIGSTEMTQRARVDHALDLKVVPVQFANGTRMQAKAEGNNAAWTCECGTLLVGRCYYQFGDTCHTKCPECGKRFRVTPDHKKRATGVIEESA